MRFTCWTSFLIIVALNASMSFSADEVSFRAKAQKDVKALEMKILQLPPQPDAPIRSAFFKLGEYGPIAKPSLRLLATRTDLGELHSAFAGRFLAEYSAFNPTALKTLLDHPNIFVRLEAVVLLADLGGSENRRAILQAGVRYPELQKTKTFVDALRQMRSQPRGAILYSSLDTMLNSTHSDSIVSASVSVRLFHDSEPATVVWGLRKLVDLRVAGGLGAGLAGRALADYHKNDPAALREFTARTNNKWLRVYAVSALGRSEEGRQIIRELLKDPAEPLRPQIEEALNN